MPVCKKCAKPFSPTLRIGGKTHNLGNRKYCLECSPFGAHNTRKLHGEPATRKPCKQCGKPRGNSAASVCYSCMVSNWRRKIKLKSIDYKGGKCCLCGFDKFPAAMDFHHVDPNEKEFHFSRVCIAWEKVKAELDKCVLLCANCHRGVHSEDLVLSN